MLSACSGSRSNSLGVHSGLPIQQIFLQCSAASYHQWSSDETSSSKICVILCQNNKCFRLMFAILFLAVHLSGTPSEDHQRRGSQVTFAHHKYIQRMKSISVEYQSTYTATKLRTPQFGYHHYFPLQSTLQCESCCTPTIGSRHGWGDSGHQGSNQYQSGC